MRPLCSGWPAGRRRKTQRGHLPRSQRHRTYADFDGDIVRRLIEAIRVYRLVLCHLLCHVATARHHVCVSDGERKISSPTAELRNSDIPVDRVGDFVQRPRRNESVSGTVRAPDARVIRVKLEKALDARIGHLRVALVNDIPEVRRRVHSLRTECRPLVRVGCRVVKVSSGRLRRTRK